MAMAACEASAPSESSSRGAEDADPLVQHLESSDDLAHLVAHGHGQHVAGAVAGLAVDAAIEPRIAVGVPHIDGVAGESGASGDSQAGVEAQNLVAAQRHFGPQLVALAVEQENAGAVAIEQVGRFAGDEIEQRAQVALRIHLLANRQNGGQFLVQIGPSYGSHEVSSLPYRRFRVYEVDRVATPFTDVQKMSKEWLLTSVENTWLMQNNCLACGMHSKEVVVRHSPLRRPDRVNRRRRIRQRSAGGGLTSSHAKSACIQRMASGPRIL